MARVLYKNFSDLACILKVDKPPFRGAILHPVSEGSHHG